MTKKTSTNGWQEHQLLVLSKLDDLKDSQEKTNKFLWEHVQSNTKDFESIRTEMAAEKAAHKAAASGQARFWALIGGISSLAAGMFGDWLIFKR